jgi:hypothetical protein
MVSIVFVFLSNRGGSGPTQRFEELWRRFLVKLDGLVHVQSSVHNMGPDSNMCTPGIEVLIGGTWSE